MARSPDRAKVIAAFAAVYIIWGSTFLAIFYAIQTLPPFLMAAVRFLVAGTLLFAWSLSRAPRRPTRAEWRSAAIVGTLLLMGGNGAVVWAEQLVPSGIAALLVAVTPCWMVLIDWLWGSGARPRVRTVAGLALGFGGIALLVGPSGMAGAAIHPIGVLVLMAGSLSWAAGSIYSRNAPSPPGALLYTGMQMLAGGTVLLLAGIGTGELGRVVLSDVSLRSILAVLYLIFFGAIVGYTAYVWLLRVVNAATVSTYAYVNPIVAVLLGWAIAGEAFTPRMAIAALIIVSGVALITIDQQRQGVGDAQAEDRPSRRDAEPQRRRG
ncbi:MAG: EamA family transporter [Gemmatimonadota bacterium]